MAFLGDHPRPADCSIIPYKPVAFTRTRPRRGATASEVGVTLLPRGEPARRQEPHAVVHLGLIGALRRRRPVPDLGARMTRRHAQPALATDTPVHRRSARAGDPSSHAP